MGDAPTSAAALPPTRRHLKPVPPELVQAAVSPKLGPWIKKQPSLDSPSKLTLVPAAAASGSTPEKPKKRRTSTPPLDSERDGGAPSVKVEEPRTPPAASVPVKPHEAELADDPLPEDDSIAVNLSPFKPPREAAAPKTSTLMRQTTLLVCDYCQGDGFGLTPKCSACRRAYCMRCQEREPLKCIVDLCVVDEATGERAHKCFGCINGESGASSAVAAPAASGETAPGTTKARKRRALDKEGNDDEDDIIFEDAERKAQEIERELLEESIFRRPVARAAPRGSAPIIRILPDPRGPNLVYEPVDRLLCELPVCFRCVENGASIRGVNTATGVSTMCGHAIYCVRCSADCLGRKGAKCPYPGCGTLIDTIVLIQNTVLKAQQT